MPAEPTAAHLDLPTGPHSTLPPTDPPTVVVPGPSATPGFELGEPIGVGGMGVVYRARDVALRRDVAVKVLKDGYPPGGAAARRFVEEARIAAQLQHPGIPAVCHVGAAPGGRPFLAMKLVKGETLADLLKANPDRGRLVAVFEGVCHAVGYAHAHGVIHRDLKPQNVMVGAHGEVQVMDWGLAKVLTAGREAEPGADPEATMPGSEIQSLRENSDHTEDGQAMGTPAFMAPE
jgi:eukaryotic-like serine/threonine-protein kinase